MSNKKEKSEKFFTISTPRKDGAILDKFLVEFGYKSFENEDREKDTRRSVLQISDNDELIEEVADFCKDNKCIMMLFYEINNALAQRTFKSDKVGHATRYDTKTQFNDEEVSKNYNLEQMEKVNTSGYDENTFTLKSNEVNKPSPSERFDRKPLNRKPLNRKAVSSDKNKKISPKPAPAKKPLNKPTAQKQKTPVSSEERALMIKKANENNPNHPSYKGSRPNPTPKVKNKLKVG